MSLNCKPQNRWPIDKWDKTFENLFAWKWVWKFVKGEPWKQRYKREDGQLTCNRAFAVSHIGLYAPPPAFMQDCFQEPLLKK